MDKKTQDLAWACLPKEVRDGMRYEYRKTLYQQVKNVLGYFFGLHNLTSDREPEEMLMVSRREVQDRFKTFNNPDWASNDEETYGAQLVIDTLDLLFGDKCLPDKELNEDNFAKSDKVTAENVTESIIAQPKTLNVGDKVKIIGSDTEVGKAKIGKVGEILDIDTRDYTCFVLYDKGQDWVRARFLEPYTEPETKDNMEEKELNLCELLKGCDETAFYSPTFSVVLLKAITEDDNKPLYWDFGVMASFTYADGRIYSDSVPTIFPSRALYEKYPLDAYSAWMEWKESRKPKRWTLRDGVQYWFINSLFNCVPTFFYEDDPEDKARVIAGNCFTTQESCEQAAEAVRETLMKFYKEHSEK